MSKNVKFAWAPSLTASNSAWDLEEDNGGWASVSASSFTSEVLYFTRDGTTAVSALKSLESTWDAASGGNTYQFQVVDAGSDNFGRRDFRLKLVRLTGTLPFRLSGNMNILLGADDNSVITHTAGEIVFDNSYAGTWMVPARKFHNDRLYPKVRAGIAVALDKTVGVHVRHNRNERHHQFFLVDGALVFDDRLDTAEFGTTMIDNANLASTNDAQAQLQRMWEEAVLEGKIIRYYPAQDPTLLTGTYDETRVLSPELIEDFENWSIGIVDEAGKDAYHLEWRSVIV